MPALGVASIALWVEKPPRNWAKSGASPGWLESCLGPAGRIVQQAWTSALAFALVAALITFGLLFLARIFRVRAREDSPLRRRTYECGEEPEGPAQIRFHSRYYVVALFFVLFDVEAAFLFPWATTLGGADASFFAMLLFIAILMLGWWYAIKKGALRWQ